MPYNVETKDGIIVRNIPDDVAPDDPTVKAKVEAARAARATGQSSETPPAQSPEIAKQSGDIEEPSFIDRYKYSRASNTDMFENLERMAQIRLGLPSQNPVDELDLITPEEYAEEGMEYTQKLQAFQQYRQGLIDAAYPDVVAYNKAREARKRQQEESGVSDSSILDTILEADYAAMAGAAIGQTSAVELAASPARLLPMMGVAGMFGGGTELTRQTSQGEELDLGDAAIAGATTAVAVPLLKGAVVGSSKLASATSKGVSEVRAKVNTNVKPVLDDARNKIQAKIQNKPVSAVEAKRADSKIIKVERDSAVLQVEKNLDPVDALDAAIKKNGLKPEDVLAIQEKGTRGIEVLSREEAEALAREVARNRTAIGSARDNLIRPVSSAIREISGYVYGAVKKVEFQTYKLQADAQDAVGTFATRMKELGKLSKEDYAAVSTALANGDIAGAKAIAAKAGNGLEESIDGLRRMLDTLYEELQLLGVKVPYKENYFPRYVEDLKGLRDSLGAKHKNILDRMMSDYAKKNDTEVGSLSTEELAEVVEQFFKQNSRESSSALAAPRQIETLNPNTFINYYMRPDEAMARYVTKAVDEITKRRFFGNAYSLTDNGFFDIDSSVTKYMTESIESGKLTTQEVADLKMNLKLLFDTAETNSFHSALKDLSYLGTLGQISSSLIQLGDVGAVMFANGIRPTVQAIAQKITGKQQISISDIGMYNQIQADIGQNGTAKWLQKTLKGTGFTSLDRFGKELAMNAGINRWAKAVQTTKGVESFYKKWGDVFEGDIDNVIAALRSGKVTEDTQYLAFLELSRLQPISKSEMPAAYLRNPKGRILYTLKSYALKQLDLVRNEVLSHFYKKNITEGTKQAIRYALLVGGGNATVQSARDMLLGKDTDSGTFGDEFSNFYWSLVFMNKYQRDRNLSQGNFGGFLGTSLTPPILDIAVQGGVSAFGVIDPSDKDTPEDKQAAVDRFAKSVLPRIPILGELGYYHFAGGKEEYNEKKKKEDRRALEKSLGY